MSETFDPYYRWLGIPPKDQPPNHYRLLSVELFEADPGVIEVAADRQMGHLRTYQTGKNGPLSQRLLNEVAAAKVCLLNRHKKAEYDARLRQQLATMAMRDAPPTAFPEIDPGLAGAIEEAVHQPIGPATIGPRRRSRTLSPGLGLLVAVAVGGVVIGSVFLWSSLLKEGSSRNSKEESLAENSRQVKSLPTEGNHKGSSEGGRSPAGPRTIADDISKTEKPPAKPTVSKSKGGKPASDPKGKSAWNLPPLEPAPTKTTTAAPPGPPPASQGPASERRLPPLPAQADVLKARALMNQLYEVDFRDATDPAAEVALAKRLIQIALAAKGDLPGQYVLFTEAKDRARQAGDLDTALQAIDEMGRVFDIPMLAHKWALIGSLDPAPRQPPQRRVLAEKCVELAEAALAEDDMAVLRSASESAEKIAATLADKDFLAEARALRQRAQKAEAALAAVSEARRTLVRDFADPGANLVLGRYLCLFKEDWEGGLSALALGNDAPWKAAAELDLRRPASPEEQARAGDAWWTMAQKQEEPEKTVLQQRAAFWYRQAIDRLRGPAAETARQRLAFVDGLNDDSDDDPRPDNPKSKPSKTAAQWITVRIVATIEGRDELRLERKQAAWVHQSQDWPASVAINGTRWVPSAKSSSQPYEKSLQVRFRYADFPSAELLTVRGRGKVELQESDSAATIVFDDTAEPGPETFQVVVRIRRSSN